MRRQDFIAATLTLAWAVAIGLSILALLAEPTGDGFVRGLNRVTGFLGWQLAAAVLSLPLWLISRRMAKGAAIRWLVRVPGWWSVALLVLLMMWIAYAMISGNRAPPPGEAMPPRPVTVPAD